MSTSKKLLLLVVFFCSSIACGQTATTNPNPDADTNSTSMSALCPHLNSVLPKDWQHVASVPLDTDSDEDEECVVFYHFDLLAGEEQQDAPVAGVVYQPDHRRPPCVIPYELAPQGGGHLCDCKCSPDMKNVLSGQPGKELIVSDRCDERMTIRASIFHWNGNVENRGYQSLGYFSGDRVKVALDEVMVDQRRSGRAQLAFRYTYHPRHKATYYQQACNGCAAGTLVKPDERELVFWPEEPKDVMLSPYPEKVVLAFYNHYTNVQEASEYFTEEGWERVGRCAGNQCGCALPYDEVERVRVLDLRCEGDWYAPTPDHQCEDCGPGNAIVFVRVRCESRDCASGCGERELRWVLVRKNNRWKLDSVR